MNRARKFFSLDSADRLLLIKALVLLLVLRAGLWVLSFKRLDSLLDRWTASPAAKRPGADSASAARVSRAVASAARALPGKKTCLVQALACRALLRRRGIEATIRLGVLKDDSGGLRAHAWVESGGRAVIGGQDLDRYVPLGRGNANSRGKKDLSRENEET